MGRWGFLPLLDLSLSFISHGTWKIRILISFDKSFSQVEMIIQNGTLAGDPHGKISESQIRGGVGKRRGEEQ